MMTHPHLEGRLRDAVRCLLDIGARRTLLPSEVTHWEALLAEPALAALPGGGVDAMKDRLESLQRYTPEIDYNYGTTAEAGMQPNNYGDYVVYYDVVRILTAVSPTRPTSAER